MILILVKDDYDAIRHYVVSFSRTLFGVRLYSFQLLKLTSFSNDNKNPVFLQSIKEFFPSSKGWQPTPYTQNFSILKGVLAREKR